MKLPLDPSNPFARAALIAGVSLALGLLFNAFFYGHVPGLAFPIYIVLVLAGLFATARLFGQRINHALLWPLAPLLFFSSMIFVRASDLLTFLNVVACLLLLLVIAETALRGKLPAWSVGDFVKIPFLPFRFLRPLFQTLFDLLSKRSVRTNPDTLSHVIRGVVMAVPVLLIFSLLFASADLVFQKFVTRLFRLDIGPETVLRAFLVLIVTLVFVGAYAYIFRARNAEGPTPQPGGFRIGHIECTILLGSVNVLFLFFILVQFTYLFGGASGLSAQGFTYAEYARRGFGELLAVAAISWLLLLTTEHYVERKVGNLAPGFKVLSALLVIQVILVLISAYIRLTLYEQAYGFTALRLLSHAFMFLLAAVFSLLLLKIYRDRDDTRFAFHVFLSAVLFLITLNLLNPDAFIAGRNLERFAAVGKLDTAYLTRLSDDAMPALIRALSLPDSELIRPLARNLFWRAHQRNASAEFKSRQSLNLSRIRANKLLDSRIPELELFQPDLHHPADSASHSQ